MADVITPAPEPEALRINKKVVKVFVLGLVVIFMLVLMALSLCPVFWWFAYHGEKLPDGMQQLSNIAVGLLFGAVFAMLKDVMGLD